MSGGKGGGSTSEVTIPEYIERAAQRNLNKAEGISQIGYTPYYGPDVASFTPMQQAAFQNTADASSAFGMAAPTSQQDIMGGMGAPTTYANGVSGYSSQPMFQQSLDKLQEERPGQFDYINSFFIDPFTGQAGSRVSAPVNYEDYMTAAEGGRVQADANRANDLAMAYVEANAGPESYYNYSNIDYSPTSSATSHITNPANGITDTSAPGVGEGAFNDFSEAVVGLGGFFDPTLKVGAINNPIKTPTVSEMVDAAPVSMDYNPTTGGYVSNTDSGPSSSPRPVSRPTGGGSSSSSVDLPGNVISRALNIGAGKEDDSDDGYVGSSGDGCFLTTAIVERRGEDDDGPTLSKLRNFRDTYMSANPKMAENIKEYYDVAPKIVSSIPEDHEDWDWIGQQVDKSVEHIDANEMSEAYDVYSNMVSRLMSNWVEKKEAF
jgi:hypothetical protein